MTGNCVVCVHIVQFWSVIKNNIKNLIIKKIVPSFLYQLRQSLEEGFQKARLGLGAEPGIGLPN